jgi:hypothetical protein
MLTVLLYPVFGESYVCLGRKYDSGIAGEVVFMIEYFGVIFYFLILTPLRDFRSL